MKNLTIMNVNIHFKVYIYKRTRNLDREFLFPFKDLK